jgi:phospholipid/cholesterol/gamma-HCH transport system substrate-binding protein
LRGTNEQVYLAAKNWKEAGERANVLMQTNEAKIGGSIDKLAALIDSVKLVADNLNRTMVSVNQLLNEDNQRKVSQILTNANNASQRMDSVMNNADQMMKDGSKAVKRFSDSADKADEVMENLRKTTKPLAERSDSIAKNLDESTAQINRFVLEMRQFLASISRGEGTVGKLLNDPALYNNVNNASIMLVQLMPRLEKILHDLETFADKLARHPELIGAQGVVRPSSGLKESPTTPLQPANYPK